MNVGPDAKLKVWDAKAITATAYSDSIVFADDANNAARMQFDIRVNEAFVTSNAGTVIFSIQDSPDGTTWTDRVVSPSFAPAGLPKSSGGEAPIHLAIPRGLKKNLRIAATVTNAFTAGKVTAILSTEN
jgi:hypothetical protein